MSKSALHAFIDRARADQSFREQLSDLGPQEIIDFAAQSGFDFSDEIKGRFINQAMQKMMCKRFRKRINRVAFALIGEKVELMNIPI